MNILFPVFALFVLTLFVLLRLAYLRFAAARQGTISPGYFRLFQGGIEPEPLAAYSRNYINLHESPTLFYVICLLIYMTGLTSPVLVVLAWIYVALRYLHSWIHLTSNHVLNRFRVFAIASLILASIWGITFVKLLSTSPVS